MNRPNFANLDCSQLHRLIQKGKWVDECKDAWRKRWALEYPWYKNISGLKIYDI